MLGSDGSTVSQLFNRPAIADLAQNKYGFITGTGLSAFVKAMQSHHLTVPGPGLTTEIEYPQPSVMSTLLQGLP